MCFYFHCRYLKNTILKRKLVELYHLSSNSRSCFLKSSQLIRRWCKKFPYTLVCFICSFSSTIYICKFSVKKLTLHEKFSTPVVMYHALMSDSVSYPSKHWIIFDVWLDSLCRMIVADELDYLITRDRSVLHDLFMLTTFPFSRCILIGTIFKTSWSISQGFFVWSV